MCDERWLSCHVNKCAAECRRGRQPLEDDSHTGLTADTQRRFVILTNNWCWKSDM